MYRGRIIYMLALSELARAADDHNQLHQQQAGYESQQPPTNPAYIGRGNPVCPGFSLVSGTQEFLDRLFLSHALRQRLAPLSRTPGLVISLSGEELSLTRLTSTRNRTSCYASWRP